jgi:hypothetical protein
MSFDISFMTHRPTGATREVPNPFKPGEMFRVTADAGLSSEERAAVRSVLESSPARSVDGGVCGFQFADGGVVEVDASRLTGDAVCSSISANVYGLSPQVVRLLFEFMQAGNFVAVWPAEDDVSALATEETRQRVVSAYPGAVVANSPEELRLLFAGGYDAWRKYRDQVVGD